MKVRIALFAALLGCLAAVAGEIVIIQPAEKDPRAIHEQSRSERELGRTMDKARSHAGTGSQTPIVIDDNTGTRLLDRSEQSIRDAQDYLRPGSGVSGSGANSTTVILRSAPPGETEKLRSKARSYIASDNPARPGKNCSEVVNTVGTIGEGSSSDRNIVVNVSEKGNSSVNVDCK